MKTETKHTPKPSYDELVYLLSAVRPWVSRRKINDVSGTIFLDRIEAALMLINNECPHYQSPVTKEGFPGATAKECDSCRSHADLIAALHRIAMLNPKGKRIGDYAITWAKDALKGLE